MNSIQIHYNYYKMLSFQNMFYYFFWILVEYIIWLYFKSSRKSFQSRMPNGLVAIKINSFKSFLFNGTRKMFIKDASRNLPMSMYLISRNLRCYTTFILSTLIFVNFFIYIHFHFMEIHSKLPIFRVSKSQQTINFT